MSNAFTTRELSAFVAGLPDEAEILVVASVGKFATMYWTQGVISIKSPTNTPAPKRWARDMLAGFTDAMGGTFPGDEPPLPPQIGNA